MSCTDSKISTTDFFPLSKTFGTINAGLLIIRDLDGKLGELLGIKVGELGFNSDSLLQWSLLLLGDLLLLLLYVLCVLY